MSREKTHFRARCWWHGLPFFLCFACVCWLPLFLYVQKSKSQAVGDAGPPTTAQFREVLKQRIVQQSDSRIQLREFKNVAGPTPAPWDTDGERRFLATYQAE